MTRSPTFWPVLPARRRLLLGVLVGALGWLGAAEVMAQPIQLEISASGDLVLKKLPQILDHAAIAPKLTSGLTTTFYFRVTSGRRDAVLGGADISVRYDLWEEVFLLTLRDGLGMTTETRATLAPTPQRDAKDPPEHLQLGDWWSQLQIPLAPSGALTQPAGSVRRAQEWVVSLTVLPFSSGELADTKRWLSRTGATGRRRSAEPGDAAQTSSHLFDLLMATSLERKALFSKKWTLNALTVAKVDRKP